MTAAGVAGFMWIEHYPFIDALYMTVITVSTVGFTEVHPLSPNGRIFTTILIIFNVGFFAYSVTSVTAYFADGRVFNRLRERTLKKKLERLSGHVIVCGFGRNGKQVCNELINENETFVVIENSSVELGFDYPNAYFLYGDATEDHVLETAGVGRARALIATLPKDADAVFVCLTAREANPRLLLISRASDDGAERKLKRAGCDHVVMPERTGGAAMAALVTKPVVVEFMRLITGFGGYDSYLQEVSVHLKTPVTIQELDLQRRTGVNVIGARDPDGKFTVNPSPDWILLPGSTLIVLGAREQITQINRLMEEKER